MSTLALISMFWTQVCLDPSTFTPSSWLPVVAQVCGLKVARKVVSGRLTRNLAPLAFAPATGTIEPGGWTSRELLHILEGLSKAGVKIVGADVVEFTPAYDNNAETTAITVSELVYEILQWMIKVPVFRK